MPNSDNCGQTIFEKAIWVGQNPLKLQTSGAYSIKLCYPKGTDLQFRAKL